MLVIYDDLKLYECHILCNAILLLSHFMAILKCTGGLLSVTATIAFR